MHFPFPSRDDPPTSATKNRRNQDDYYNGNRSPQSFPSSSSCDGDDPFTVMRRFVDQQFSSFFGSFNPLASFDEFFNDDRRERVLRQQRQCDELRRRIYEEMEGRDGAGNGKFDQKDSRHNETARHGDEWREWAKQGTRDSYRSNPRISEVGNEERGKNREDKSGSNGWRKWWCDRHSENDNLGDLRWKGPWANHCPRSRRDEHREIASGSNSAGGGSAHQDDGLGQSSTQPGYVRIIPETFPLFYSRQYLINSPYSPLYLELDYRLSNIRWRAAYEELLQAEHGVKLKGASHGADNRSIQQDPMRWMQRVLSSRMISKTSNGPFLIWSNGNQGEQSDKQKQRQVGVEKLDEKLRQREQHQQDSQILRALTEAEKKASNDQYQYQRQHQHQRQAEAQYEDFQPDPYEQFLNEYNRGPNHARDGKAIADPQHGTKNSDTLPPKSPISKSSAASTSNPSAALSRPTNNDQTNTPTSLLTSTERRVLPDGTVTTKTVLKRRFADGSEETTENESTSLHGREDKGNVNSTNSNNNIVAPGSSSSSSSSSNRIWDENSEWPTSLAKFGLSGSGSGSGSRSGSGAWSDLRSSEFGPCHNHGTGMGLYDDDVIAVENGRGNGFDEHQHGGQTSLDKRREMRSHVKGGKVNKNNDDSDDGKWKSWFWSKG